MDVGDQAKATRCLERFGYYRLSGYWYPMRQSIVRYGPNGSSTDIHDNFRQGVEFRHVADLCVFDKRLKLLMLDALERIEVALRVDIAHLMGAKSPWAHLDPNLLHGNFTSKTNPITLKTRHQDWIDRLSITEQRSREDFVNHFRQKYSDPLPLWISIELWDFGTLSMFLEGLKVSDKEAIAQRYGVPRADLLTSWTRTLNHVRNICAHHSRLWNRPLADQPKLPKQNEVPLLDHLRANPAVTTRLYGAAAITAFLMKTVYPTSTWKDRFKNQIDAFPQAPGVEFAQARFPANWQREALWR